VGFDKLVQILDPRYYEEREAALAALFAKANFLVAPRDAHTEADIRTLLADPANRRYAARIAPLPIDPALGRVSSTCARAAAAAGRPTAGLVPDVVAQFIAATGCYGAPDGQGAYAARAAALATSARGGPPGDTTA
jgi:hypothetical protein